MFHLVVTACLLSSPEICEPRLLPAGDSPDRQGCLKQGEPIARDWIARHPDLRGSDIACVETTALPALATTQIAPGVYVHRGSAGQISPENAGRIANLGFVVGDTVAVIDAGASRAEGEALYAAIRRVTDRPVSHLVLTHMHPDHIFGAEVFAEAGATTVASARLPDAVALRAESWMRGLPDQIGAGALAGTRIVGVDLPVAAVQSLDLGGRVLVVTPVPPAHTDNDVTVFDAKTATLFTGDLIFQGLAPSIDGSLTGWLDWMAKGPPTQSDGVRPALLVPGHGPVLADWTTAITPQSRYLHSLRDTVQALIDQGTPLSTAVPKTVARMQPLAADWQDFDAITARNAATAYSELEWAQVD